tara:strand:- start:2313 stop:2438 length:126 start_codon:yes stop_codon:yes gene_type:complete
MSGSTGTAGDGGARLKINRFHMDGLRPLSLNPYGFDFQGFI